MSEHSIPKTIDIFKYTDQSRELQGILALSGMPRLEDVLVSLEGDVNVKLSFSKDEQGQRIVIGALEAMVELICERCLTPVTKKVSSNFELGVVMSDEEAKALPRAYEPLLVESESLNVNDLVEEELMLSLPMFAYHDTCDGDYQLEAEPDEIESTETEIKKDNPFDVLSVLKGSAKDS